MTSLMNYPYLSGLVRAEVPGSDGPVNGAGDKDVLIVGLQTEASHVAVVTVITLDSFPCWNI